MLGHGSQNDHAIRLQVLGCILWSACIPLGRGSQSGPTNRLQNSSCIFGAPPVVLGKFRWSGRCSQPALKPTVTYTRKNQIVLGNMARLCIKLCVESRQQMGMLFKYLCGALLVRVVAVVLIST